MGFLPLDRVPDDPNTAAGGRAVPEPTANVNNSVQHRLLSAVVSNLSTACSLLNPAAAQSVLLLQKQLQKAMQSGTQEEQAKLTSEFFYQFSALATDFHKPALSLVMSSSAAGAAAASDAPVAAAASEPTSGSAAAAAAAADSPQVQQLNSMLKPPKLTFLPSFVDYKQHMEGSEVLNKLSAADPDMGLYVQIGTGQLHGISAAVNDDGSNILLISEKQCSRMGATIYRDSSPLLKGLDGEMRNYIIGRTGPAKLILGRGTPYPLTVDVPCMWVVAGDAGGMYDVLISKDTFKAWFAHVNPAYRHLVWYPLAAQNDFSVLAGVPVRGSVTKQSALAAIRQQAVVGAAVAGAAAARGVIHMEWHVHALQVLHCHPTFSNLTAVHAGGGTGSLIPRCWWLLLITSSNSSSPLRHSSSSSRLLGISQIPAFSMCLHQKQNQRCLLTVRGVFIQMVSGFWLIIQQ